MAISATHYQLLRELRIAGALALGEPILEIGKANLYGDCDPREWFADIDGLIPEGDYRHEMRARLAMLIDRPPSNAVLFELAKLVYAILFDAKSVPDAIDLCGEGDFWRLDLNHPIASTHLRAYGTVINHGTAEHIFDIAQVFRTVHDACRVGGLMIHESPFTGWVDHGFYTLQPTLFYDLAAANGYGIELIAVEHLASRSYFCISSREHIHELARRDQLPYNSMLFVAMRKTADEPFKIPMQGVYAGTVSEEATKSWKGLR